MHVSGRLRIARPGSSHGREQWAISTPRRGGGRKSSSFAKSWRILRRIANACYARCDKILLVDDNGDSLAAMATVLGLAGHEVKTADDGPAALAIVRAGYTPDIAFLDIGLPGMNGYELAQALRTELPARTPLVALTGYGADVDRRRSEQAGFARHLVKPVTYDALTGCMRDTLPPHEPAGAAPR